MPWDQHDLPLEVLTQRLLISHGLFAASASVARRLGCTGEDLETLIASYAEEAELKEGENSRADIGEGG